MLNISTNYMKSLKIPAKKSRVNILSERVESTYKEYISIPKKDGNQRKDVKFRWFDFKNFIQEDYDRKNNWDVLGFN